MGKNNQTARVYENLYEDIKKYDVNALRSFIFHNTEEIIKAIEYWQKRRTTLIKSDDKQAVDIADAEVMRLESFLLAKSQLTMDFFRIETISGINDDSAMLNKHLTIAEGSKSDSDLPFDEENKSTRWGYLTLEGHVKTLIENKTTPETVKSEVIKMLVGGIIDLGDSKVIEIKTAEEAEKYFNTNFAELFEAKSNVVQMMPDKIKLSDLKAKCRSLLIEDKGVEAKEWATKYLSVANYLPDGKKQKADKWHEARIDSWLKDISKTIKPDEKKQKEINPIPGAKETVENAPNTIEEKEVATQEKTSRDISVTIEHWDKLCNWLKENGFNLLEVFDKEMIEELSVKENREKYGAVLFSSDDAEEVIKKLTDAGIDAMFAEEENEEDESLDSNLFLNESNTLKEEIQHVENLVKSCIEFRGSKDGAPQNIEKIKEVATLFFGVRSTEDYIKGKDEFINIILNRPSLFLNSKTNTQDAKLFFSHMCMPKDGMKPYVEGEERNLYHKIVEEIKTASTNKDFEEKYLIDLTSKLRGKILLGSTSDGKNLVNKCYFYTTYHILHFVDQIVVSTTGEQNATSKTDVANVSTTQAPGASENPAEMEKSQSVEEKADELILNIVKNAGVLEDALNNLEYLKNQTVKDPWETGNILLNEENYKKYVTKRFEELKEGYFNSLTEYPAKSMAHLISMAHSQEKSVADFVKENIELVRKPNGSFLSIVSEINKEKVIQTLSSEKDFTKYVQEAYITLDKIQEEEIAKEKEAEKNKKTYPASKFKDFKDFETSVFKKASEEKLPVEKVIEWAKTEILDKAFLNDPTKDPLFKSENTDNLVTYVEIITKKAYETPESLEKANKRIDEIIGQEITKSDTSLYNFIQNIRKLCTDEKIDTSLKDIKKRSLDAAKKANKKMYDKYMKTKEDLKLSGLIATEQAAQDAIEANAATSGKKDKVIVMPEETKTAQAKAKTVEEELAEKLTLVKTENETKEVLKNFNVVDNLTIVAKLLKEIVCDKKQIKDLTLSETELNTWLNNLKPIEETETIVRKDYTNETFEKLANATDKMSFKKALREIIERFNDSSDLRNAIIATIKSGKGFHTKKLAEQPTTESHKMIKKAFENYEDGKE